MLIIVINIFGNQEGGNKTQGMEDKIIIQVDSNSFSDYLNVIMNADDKRTSVQLYKASHFGYILLCWSSVIVL